MPGHRLTLCLSALAAEAAPLASLLEEPARVTLAGRTCRLGRLYGERLCIAAGGVGAEASRRALAELAAALPVGRVLLLGMAGGLAPALAIGDVVVASRPRSWARRAGDLPGSGRVLGATGGAPPYERGAPAPPDHRFRVVAGSILTWPTLVLEDRLRERLRYRYRADCVDMETGPVAHLCAARKLPFLAIRGIADRPGVPLDDLSRDHLALAIRHATLVALAAVAGPGSLRSEAALAASGPTNGPRFQTG